MQKDLTISIVVYHNTEEAMKAVRSIEEQTAASVSKEIFIVDNEAAERSEEDRQAFRDFLSAYSDVRYLPTEKNVGYGAGNNRVLPYIDSRYHAVLNPDILLRGDTFSNILAFMDENPDCGMAVPRLTNIEGELQKVYRRELTLADLFIRFVCRDRMFQKRQDYHTLQDMDFSVPFQLPFAQGSFLVIRTALLQELQGFDERYFLYMEDADLCKRVNQVSKLMYFPGAEAIHVWKRASYHDRSLLKIHLSSMWKYFRKWGLKLW